MKFEVIWDNQDDDVLLFGEVEGQVVLAALKRAAIEDDCDPPQTGLSLGQRQQIADANIDVLSVYLSRVVEPALVASPQRQVPTRITIQTGDLPAAGIRLSTSILGQPKPVWVDVRSGKFGG